MKYLLFIFFLFTNFILFSQISEIKKFQVDFEYRPRFEYRNGYKTLPIDSLKPAAFISQRSRLNFDFQHQKMELYFSIQDVSVWGQNIGSPAFGSLHVFESYAVFPVFKKWNLKIGRQAVELDNGRLFSKANWNQFSNAHDGLRLKYNSKNLSNDLMFFYNQSGFSTFGTNYPFNYYKYLFVQYGTFQIHKNVEIKMMNAVDGFESFQNENVIYARATSGGRITFEKNSWNATLAAYYQYGQTQSGDRVQAYYLQPELSFKSKKLNLQLGMEYLSGGNLLNPGKIDRSFSTLYGVAFKFMGRLDYFTSFPDDVNGGGLINPHLFLGYKLSNKWHLNLQTHGFFLQNNSYGNDQIDAFLGLEYDFFLKYNFSDNLFVDFGICTLNATQSMQILKGGNYHKMPLYSYLMLTWKPQLMRFK